MTFRNGGFGGMSECTMQLTAVKCKQCGASLKGHRCAYCGAEYARPQGPYGSIPQVENMGGTIGFENAFDSIVTGNIKVYESQA